MQESKIVETATTEVKKILDLLGIEAEVKASIQVDEAEEKFLNIEMEGKELWPLVGYRGRTLTSLQVIFSQIINKNTDKDRINVMLDVNSYRKRRNEHLVSIAQRGAEEARENEQNVELPPLSPFERRIIHMALKNEKDVSSESEGEGDLRHIVIKPEKK